MNIWLEGLFQEEINKNNKPEDVSLAKKQEELQDSIANGRSENVKADRIRNNGKG